MQMIDVAQIEAHLADYRQGLAQLEQQVLVQRGAILALEQVLRTAEAREEAEAARPGE